MALAVDAVTNASGSGAGPFTWSHTCAGSDRVLVVGISYYDSGDTVSAITYNSVAMTVVGSSTVSNGQCTVSLYRLIAPATGSNTVSVTFTGSVFDFKAGSISFTGADQTTPLGAANTATGSSTTPSVNITSATGEIVLDTIAIVHSGTLTVDGSQAEQWNGVGGFGFIKGGGSTEDGSTTTTMSWSNSSSQDWALTGVSVKPVAAAPSGVHQLCLTGVGN